MKKIEMAKGAKKILELCGNVKKGDRVLIVTDTGIEWSITESLAIAARAAEAEVAVVLTLPGEKPGEEPSPMVASAMLGADVILSPTTRTIYHSVAAGKALEKGARLLSLTEITEKILISGGIDADFIGLQPVVEKVKELFGKGKRAHITTEAGTDLWVNMEGRPAHACSGLCHHPGDKLGIPEVEVFIAPVENDTNGILVVDACIAGIGRVETPVTIKIEKGRAVSITGGSEAERLKNILRETGEEKAYIIAEFALGLNDKARVIGDIIEDEGAYGTGHFAFGNNVHFDGQNDADLHLDMVYWHPTVEIDGAVIMKNGVLE